MVLEFSDARLDSLATHKTKKLAACKRNAKRTLTVVQLAKSATNINANKLAVLRTLAERTLSACQKTTLPSVAVVKATPVTLPQNAHPLTTANPSLALSGLFVKMTEEDPMFASVLLALSVTLTLTDACNQLNAVWMMIVPCQLHALQSETNRSVPTSVKLRHAA